MLLSNAIAEARKRQQRRELEQAFLEQFGDDIMGWFNPVFDSDVDGAPEVRITHNGTQIAVWRDNEGTWYVEGEALRFDYRDQDEASDALLVAIDDLAPAVEQTTEV